MASNEKGYIQFASEWHRAQPPARSVANDLVRWRDRLYRLGLIGVYPDGIGFGNLSSRLPDGTFVITGTGTGRLPTIGPEHLTTVTAFNVAENRVTCRGPVEASSEAMSHAAVYVAEPTARVVIHVHHLGLWERLFDAIPTTDPTAEAGTPAMGFAIDRLLKAGVPDGLFVMGGHREGLMAFGETADEAGESSRGGAGPLRLTGVHPTRRLEPDAGLLPGHHRLDHVGSGLDGFQLGPPHGHRPGRFGVGQTGDPLFGLPPRQTDLPSLGGHRYRRRPDLVGHLAFSGGDQISESLSQHRDLGPGDRVDLSRLAVMSTAPREMGHPKGNHLTRQSVDAPGSAPEFGRPEFPHGRQRRGVQSDVQQPE